MLINLLNFTSEIWRQSRGVLLTNIVRTLPFLRGESTFLKMARKGGVSKWPLEGGGGSKEGGDHLKGGGGGLESFKNSL